MGTITGDLLGMELLDAIKNDQVGRVHQLYIEGKITLEDIVGGNSKYFFDKKML